jgi:hypothetical protein
MAQSGPPGRAASGADGSRQPNYFEADLVKIKGLIHDWRMLWDKANS